MHLALTTLDMDPALPVFLQSIVTFANSQGSVVIAIGARAEKENGNTRLLLGVMTDSQQPRHGKTYDVAFAQAIQGTQTLTQLRTIAEAALVAGFVYVDSTSFVIDDTPEVDQISDFMLVLGVSG